MEPIYTDQSSQTHTRSQVNWIQRANFEGFPLIDAEVFANIKVYGQDPSFVLYLVELFEKHGKQSKLEIEEAIDKKEPATLRRVAHRWRGSCLNIGAARLANELLLLDLATPVSLELVSQATELMPYVSSSFEESCVLLRQLIEN